MMACLPTRATLTVGSEYYIWLNIYEKLLGTNEAGDGPALSAYGTKTDGYVFVAENSGISKEKYRELVLNTGELVTDIGTILEGKEAVECGLIDEVGTLSDATDALYEMIRERKNKQ